MDTTDNTGTVGVDSNTMATPERLNGHIEAPADPRTSRAPQATPEAATRPHSAPHGTETADTLPAWLYQRFAPHGPAAWDVLSDDDRAYWEHQAAAVRRAVERGGFKVTAEETHVVADDSNDPEHVDDCPGCATAPDFFEPGRTYADSESSKYDWKFRVDTVTTHPDNGERIALGWRHFRGEWEPYAYGEDDWDIHQHAGLTEAGEVPA